MTSYDGISVFGPLGTTSRLEKSPNGSKWLHHQLINMSSAAHYPFSHQLQVAYCFAYIDRRISTLLPPPFTPPDMTGTYT